MNKHIVNKHIVKHIVVCSLLVKLYFVDSVKGPLLAHRVPPVIEGRGGCSSFPSLPSSALSLIGTAAGGVTCCVAEGRTKPSAV